MRIEGDPVKTVITRWPKAIPQYNVGYAETLAAIDACESGNPGLYFCSNYRGGISVGDCLMSADRTAARVLAFVQRNPHIHSSTIHTGVL
jgi:oxygen-dependent protoporphyrinogen oxidase